MVESFLNDKKSWYYNVEKSQIHPLIQEGSNKILDLGCGTGRLGKNLMEQKKASEIIGVELFKPAANEAAKLYKKVHFGNIETIKLEYENYFDFVICGDILEHLQDPWKMLKRINKVLKNNGTIICSVPNIRFWKNIWELLVFGKWEYKDAGILDRTHLRFFTKSSFVQALKEGKFKIVYLKIMIWGNKKPILNKVTFGLFEELLGSQILVSAKKA